MKTIQLKTSTGAVMNIGICGDSLLIMGEKYRLSGMMDITRLSMFLEDLKRRTESQARYGVTYTGCCDSYRDATIWPSDNPNNPKY